MNHPFSSEENGFRKVTGEPAAYETRKGDFCIHLAHAWPEILEELNAVGALAFLSPHGGCNVAQWISKSDFQAVPGTTEMVELSTGLTVDWSRWAFALAVEERHPGQTLLGLQFFDTLHQGHFKVLLTRDSDVEAFHELLAVFASSRPLPRLEPRRPILPGTVDAWEEERIRQLRQSWASFNPFHADGVVALPSGTGLQLAGLSGPFAERAEGVDFVRMVTGAHVEGRRMELAAFQSGLHRTARFVPRRVERCPSGFHIIDDSLQLFVPHDGCLFWRTEYPGTGTSCLEVFDPAGDRLLALRVVPEKLD